MDTLYLDGNTENGVPLYVCWGYRKKSLGWRRSWCSRLDPVFLLLCIPLQPL